MAGQLQALIRLVARPWRLSSTQALILFTLPLDGIPHSDLARRLGLDASTITRVVVKMQTAGLVERLRSTQDRRVFLVTPT
ncbi:MAG: MarR family transcriptional regulator, partial [Candidatus Marinimicrobia bacterium]|nr:MarR family transcriptional regulator [Candidatus Neomarinimicrobiota bacterium]